MTNHDIIKIVNLAVNKDINGNAFSTEEYKTMINAHSLRLFADYLGLTQEYQGGVPVARQGVSISKINQMALLPFQEVETLAVAGGQLNLTGKNVAYIISVTPNPLVKRGFDEVFPDELPFRLADPVTMPTTSDPIIVWRSEVECLVYPATVSSVLVFYYTYPTEADFTFTSDVNLLPVYNSIAEMEWRDVDMVEIAYRMIREAGVNVEKQDAVQYAQQVINSGR